MDIIGQPDVSDEQAMKALSGLEISDIEFIEELASRYCGPNYPGFSMYSVENNFRIRFEDTPKKGDAKTYLIYTLQSRIFRK